MDCNCPEPTALTTIVAEACGVDLKQIQRVAFQRVGNVFDGTLTPAIDIDDLADWQAFLSAVGDTKIVVTPLIGGDPIIEPGEAITTGGGDNSTLNGVEEIEGVNPSTFSCVFKSLSSTVETQLKALICEKFLVAYLILQGGRIACALVQTNVHTGFNIQSIFVSDRGNAGFGTKDTVSMRFSLAEGYSNNLVIIKPNFNPLTDI